MLDPIVSKILIGAFIALSFSGCMKLSVETGQLNNFRSEMTISVDSLQTLPRANWLRDQLSRVYVSGKTVEVKGSCSRGVRTVQAIHGGKKIGTDATCLGNGTYLWRAELADGEYEITFQPKASGDSLGVGNSVQEVVVIDTVPPPPPVILTNDGNPVAMMSSSLQLEGEFFADGIRVQALDGGKVEMNAGLTRFYYDVKLAAGETAELAFAAVDFAGNRSEYTRIQVSHFGVLDLSVIAPVGVGTWLHNLTVGNWKSLI
ncbi:MAG: hypothetical protein AB7P04_03290 [Bacteriovoracia bacterium]